MQDRSMERRRYPRFPVHYDVICENSDNELDQPIRAIAENASRTGIKVRYAGIMQANRNVRVQILKTVSSKPIVCFGQIVWEKDSPLVYGERTAGINITKIGWTETDKLITNIDI